MQGREGFPAVPPRLALRPALRRRTSASLVTPGLRLELICTGAMYCAPTVHSNGSGGNFGQLAARAGVSVCAPASLSASADLLSSVIACGKGRLLGLIIARNNGLSRGASSTLRYLAAAGCARSSPRNRSQQLPTAVCPSTLAGWPPSHWYRNCVPPGVV